MAGEGEEEEEEGAPERGVSVQFSPAEFLQVANDHSMRMHLHPTIPGHQPACPPQPRGFRAVCRLNHRSCPGRFSH